MTHLTAEQIVEALDGVLATSERAHLDACESCQREIASLAALLKETQAVELPEPSPLFWNHFTARVHEATSGLAVPPVTAWWHGLWRPIGALAVTAGAVLVFNLARTPGSAPAVGALTGDTLLADAAARADIADVQPWDLVKTVTSDLAAADLHEVAAPTTDATAAVIADLSSSQREALMRLLKAEMAKLE